MDRPPSSDWETSTFTYKPANEWDEHWVLVDVPAARQLINDGLDFFARARWGGLLTGG